MTDVMGNAFMIVLVGLVVVFAVLILLIAIIWIAGKVISGTSDREADLKSSSAVLVEESGAKVDQLTPDTGDMSDELLAVIAAAVAVVMANEPQAVYTMRSVRRAGEGRPIWAVTGMMENTRPF